MAEVGKWAFLIGFIVAIILGIIAGVGTVLGATTAAWLTLLLVVLGLIVGFANITAKETTAFLIAALGLLVARTAGLSAINTLIPYLGSILEGIVNYLLVIVAPAALIVAVKAFYEMASKK
ncbi:MAG: hypothetical protein QXH80_04115 [Candidatus Nanoarchaeia archaeon]